LQVSVIEAYSRYVGEIQTIGRGSIHVISITDLQFVPFADISLEHKIFSHGRISALLQVSVTLNPPDTNGRRPLVSGEARG
jgi:hypothetical protein